MILVAVGAGRLNGKESSSYWFWAEEDAARTENVVAVEEQCCCSGKTAEIRVENTRKLPQGYGGDTVLEFDAGGNVLGEWMVPIEIVVLGVEDDRLLATQYDQDWRTYPKDVIAISESGDLSYESFEEPPPEALSIECPEFEQFEDSAYLQCLSFVDLGDFHQRLLAYQGPCT